MTCILIPCFSISTCFFTDGDEEFVGGLEFKKRKVVEETQLPPRASGRTKKKVVQTEASGSGASKLNPYGSKKGRAQKGKNLGPSEIEEEPEENTADMSAKEWRIMKIGRAHV